MRGDYRSDAPCGEEAVAAAIQPVASVDDIRIVQSLARTIWFDHYPGIISWAQVHYMLERGYREDVIAAEIAEGVVWEIVRDRDVPVGFCAYRLRDRDVSLDKLYVLATARRGGFARACVARAAKYAREHGRESVSLTVNKRNTAAIRAYLAMGFSFAGAIVKDIGGGFVMDDYVMRLRV
jgi:ribosomal protein S18 acetylase RimI-like enzyme